MTEIKDDSMSYYNSITKKPWSLHKRPPRTKLFLINHGGQLRKYYVRLPLSYNGKKSTPVILNFHGGGGSAEGHMQMTKMSDKSEDAGFIIVFPVGAGKNPYMKMLRFWNPGTGPNGNYHGDPFFAETDDVGFVNLMLDDLESKFNIDKKGIFAAGFSNGGVLCHLLACRLSHRIAAIASVAGPFWNFPDSCSPSRPVSIVYFHGTADTCAPYYGGLSKCELGISRVGRIFPSVKKTASIWIKKNNCPSVPKITHNTENVICETYGTGDKNSEVVIYSIKGGGHTWPGGLPYKIPGFDIGEVTNDINANDIICEFFKKHTMPNK